MVPKLRDIMELLDEIAPFSTAEDWDNSGLQVGFPSMEINRILMALDPTGEATGYAADINAQLLLTHHPLIFEPIPNLNTEAYPGDVIHKALAEKISIVAVHTNLDLAKEGISYLLARLFGLQAIEVLQEKGDSGNEGIGIGRVGNLPKSLRLSQLIETVKELLGSQSLRFAGSDDMEIRRVAVVGGSGGSLIREASRKGADLLVTGDIKHHDALEAQTLGLALIDGGHFHTESTAFGLFADDLRVCLAGRGWDVALERYNDEEEVMKFT